MKTSGVKVEFKTSTVNAKNEHIISFVVKGELKDHQILSMDKLKRMGACFMDLYSSQTDIDDYSGHDDESEAEPQHKGLSFKIEDGAVRVDPNQLDMDDVVKDDTYIVVDKNGNETVESGDPKKQVDWLDDGYPSENEKEIQSMRSEAEDEIPDELE